MRRIDKRSVIAGLVILAGLMLWLWLTGPHHP